MNIIIIKDKEIFCPNPNHPKQLCMIDQSPVTMDTLRSGVWCYEELLPVEGVRFCAAQGIVFAPWERETEWMLARAYAHGEHFHNLLPARAYVDGKKTFALLTPIMEIRSLVRFLLKRKESLDDGYVELEVVSATRGGDTVDAVEIKSLPPDQIIRILALTAPPEIREEILREAYHPYEHKSDLVRKHWVNYMPPGLEMSFRIPGGELLPRIRKIVSLLELSTPERGIPLKDCTPELLTRVLLSDWGRESEM